MFEIASKDKRNNSRRKMISVSTKIHEFFLKLTFEFIVVKSIYLVQIS